MQWGDSMSFAGCGQVEHDSERIFFGMSEISLIFLVMNMEKLLRDFLLFLFLLLIVIELRH